MLYFLYLFCHGLRDNDEYGYKQQTILYSTRTPTWNIQQKGVVNKLNAGVINQKRADEAYDYVNHLLEKACGKLDEEKFSLEKCIQKFRAEQMNSGEIMFHINVVDAFVARSRHRR